MEKAMCFDDAVVAKSEKYHRAVFSLCREKKSVSYLNIFLKT